MFARMPVALRIALLAIVTSVPICWAVIGLAAAQWFAHERGGEAFASRGFGPAALLATVVAATMPETPFVADPLEPLAPLADPDAPSAPNALMDCCDAMAPAVAPAGFAWSSSDEGEFRFALLDPKSDANITMSDQSDWRRFDWLKAQARGPFVWFWLDGAEHTSDDAQVVADVRAAMKPIEVLGQKQGKLGAKQGQLGARQGQIGAKLGLMGARLAQLQVQAGLSGDRDERSQRELAAVQSEMEAIARQQRPLGDEMGRLGAEMGRLGAEMGRASQQAKKTVRLRLERAVREGRAERLHADA